MTVTASLAARAARLVSGCCVLAWMLLCADAAGAQDLTRVWRQLTQAPFLLPGTKTEGALRESFVVTAAAWTEWHVAAPGIIGLKLTDEGDPNQSLEAFRSNGTGLLAPVGFAHDASTGLWQLEDLPYRSRILHVRARGRDVELLVFQLKETTQAPPVGQPLLAPEGTAVRIRRHRLDFPESYIVLPAGEPVRFVPATSRTARLRLRMPFADAPRGWQDYRLQVRAGDELLQAPRLRAYQDRTQTWILNGQPALLSRTNSFFVDLPDDATSLTLTSSHRVFVQSEEVLKRPYLAPAWNRTGTLFDPSNQQPGSFDLALAAQQHWQATVALATDNLRQDAPLAAASGRALAAQTSSVTRARTRQRIMSRYTKLQNLLPKMALTGESAAQRTGDRVQVLDGPGVNKPFNARRAEFEILPLLAPEAVGEPRWTSAVQRESTLGAAQAATFVTVPANASLTYAMPGYEDPARLRLIARHPESQLMASVSVSFAGATAVPTRLLLDSSRARLDRLDPAPTRAYFGNGPRIPAAATAAVELTVPARSRELRLSNTGDVSVTMALQLREPRKYRHEESDWLMLRRDSSDRLLDLWWETWDSGLDEDGRWQAGAASRTVLLNGLIPVLHYLSEQAGRFGSFAPVATTQTPALLTPLAPSNVHCSGEPTKSAPARWKAALRWESRRQWINANKAWLDALPGLLDEECVDAHMHFAGNLVNLGEHQLAEKYWRYLILRTSNATLRASSVAALDHHFARQKLDQSRLQLLAYVALRWRDPQAMRLMAGVLFDVGQDRFGIDVALLLPDAGHDGQLRAALTRLGWSTLGELLEGDPPAADTLTHETLRAAPLQQMVFSDSAVIVDRLLAESSTRPIARPNSPLTAVVRGPVRLQVSMRPLVGSGMPPAGWALITVDDDQLPVPVSSRAATDRYQLASGQLGVGTTTRRELRLGPGDHQLRVEPLAGAVAVSLLSRAPWREFVAEVPAISDKRLRVLGGIQPAALVAGNSGSSADARLIPGSTAGFPPAQGSEGASSRVWLADDVVAWQAVLAMQPDTPAATRELMAVLAYTAEHDETRRASAVARGEWLAFEAADDRKVIALRNRTRQRTRWQRTEQVQRSAGLQIEPLNRFSPDAEYWRVRNLFLPAWQPGEEMLGSGASLSLSLTASAPTRLRLELTCLSLGIDVTPDLKTTPGVNASIRHNGMVQVRALEGNPRKHEVTLELERGAHDIELSLSELPSSSLVKLRLLQLRGNQWVTLDRSGRKKYLLAAPAQPALLDVSGPAWVRVDELTMAGTISTYRHLARGQRLGPLIARSSQTSRFRVFTRSLQADTGSAAESDDVESKLATMTLVPEVEPWPAVPAVEKAPDVVLPELAADAPVTVIGLQAPTYSASVGWFADDQAEEDVRRPVRDYLELAVSRRQRNARDGVYVEANGFARDSADGDPSFGTSAYYWRRLRNTPFSLRADGRLLGQNADSGFAWATHGQLVLRQFTLGGRQRRHRSEIKLFARYLTENRGGRELDPDIYSPYLRDHTSGVEFMHRISAQPTWDSELFGEVRVRSNELHRPTMDYLRSRLGARAQLGPLQLGSELQVTRYVDDDDRDDSSTVGRLKLLGRWYGPQLAGGRIELRGQLDYNMDRQSSSGWVRLLWHFDRVQGIDDFHGDRHWFDPLLVERLRGGLQ